MIAKTAENQGSKSLAAILFAVFAVALIVAFLAFRGSDIGQLPTLVGNLGSGPLFGPGIVDSFVGVLVALLIGVSCFGLGSVILEVIWIDQSRMGRNVGFAISLAVGASVWSLVWFFEGLAGSYSSRISLLTSVAGLALAGFKLFRGENKFREDDESGISGVTAWLIRTLIFISVGLAFIASVAPPTAKDTLLYHFAVPKAFIAQNSSAFIEGNIASYLALGTEMHTVWAMLLGNLFSSRAGEAAAGVTIFLFFPLLILAVYGWARETGISRVWSLTATLIVATVPTAFHVASSGYIDVALALFVTLAIYALCRWCKLQDKGSLILMAIFLGAALSIKLTAVFVIAAFALVILLRARNLVATATAPGSDAAPFSMNPGRVALSGFAALLLAGVIASPWYIRTWAATGSPVFPFYMSIWKGEANGWDVERSSLFQEMNKQYGGADKNAADYLLAPINLSVTAQPEIAEHFDGVLGVTFLCGLPLLVWGLWKFDLPVEAKIGAGVAGIMFLFWLFSSQQLRYLLPILPALAVAMAASADVISSGKKGLRQVLQYGFVTAGLAGILVTAAWFCQKAPLRVVLGGETRDQYLTRNLDYYPYYQAINTDTATDAKIWLINMRRDTYNIERPVFSDYLFEDWTLRKMVWDSRSVQELKAKTAAMGIKYVLTRHDFLFDYDKSSLVDDKKPRTENEAKLKIAKDFILDPANTVRADNKFSLVKVF